MNPIAAPSEGCDEAGARISRAPAKALYSRGMSVFILIAGYLAASLVFREPGLYAPVSGVIPLVWWTAVFGKLCVAAVMTALIGYRLKRLSLDWRAAGWGKAEPLRELGWAGLCAAVVWIISFFLLRADSNQGAVLKWSGLVDGGSSGKLLFFLSACLLGGTLEELVYRGGLRAFLCRGEDSAGANVTFIAASALVFAAFHWVAGPADFLVYAAMGGVFAATLVRSGSLRSVMLAHILVNTAHLFGLGHYVRYLFGAH